MFTHKKRPSDGEIVFWNFFSNLTLVKINFLQLFFRISNYLCAGFSLHSRKIVDILIACKKSRWIVCLQYLLIVMHRPLATFTALKRSVDMKREHWKIFSSWRLQGKNANIMSARVTKESERSLQNINHGRMKISSYTTNRV